MRRIIAWLLLIGFIFIIVDIITLHKLTSGEYSKYVIITYAMFVVIFLVFNSKNKEIVNEEKNENTDDNDNDEE